MDGRHAQKPRLDGGADRLSPAEAAASLSERPPRARLAHGRYPPRRAERELPLAARGLCGEHRERTGRCSARCSITAFAKRLGRRRAAGGPGSGSCGALP